MTNRNIILTCCLITFLALGTRAQDQNYSQFFNNDIYYNPATTGLYLGLRTTANYRNQWTNMPYDFKSYNFSMDIAERALPGAGGLGILVHRNSEGEGLLEYTMAALSLSTRIPVNENLITQFGVSAAFAQRQINWDKLVFSDQLDGIHGVSGPSNFAPPDENKVVYPDFNVGTVLNYVNDNVNARVGAAFHHIFTPKIGFIENQSELPMKFVAHSDIMFLISDNSVHRKNNGETKINPGVMYENQQGASSFSMGINGFKSLIYLGLWYRNEDINTSNVNYLIFMTGVNLPFNSESRIKLMYSYDYVMDKIAASGGSHEISLIIEFDKASMFGYNPGTRAGNRNGPLECPAF